MKTKRNKRTRKTTATDKRKPAPHQSQATAQPVMHHIRELRRRLFWTVLLGLIVGGVVYNYHGFFIELVMAPLGDQKLVYLNPAGGFNFIFMVTFYATMLIMLPFLLYQVYAFIKPAVPTHTRRLSIGVALAATILMATGATFAYMYAVPAGLHFLTHFASDYVVPTLTADSYLKFVLGYILGIALLFQVPLLLMFWHWINPLTPKGLLKSERFIVLGAFVVAAIISPSPDAMTQSIIAVPIIIVYQLGVIAVLISIRRRRKQLSRTVAKPTQAMPAFRPLKTAPVRSVAVQPVAFVSQVPVRLERSAMPIASADGVVAVRRTRSGPIVPRVSGERILKVAPRSHLISDFAPSRRFDY